jgi:hypothetical protein
LRSKFTFLKAHFSIQSLKPILNKTPQSESFFHEPFQKVALYVSVWALLLSSAERTAAVMFPLNVASIFSRRRCLLIITLFFSVFLTVSSSFQTLCTDFNPHKRHCQISGGLNSTCFKLHTLHLFYRSIVSTWLPIIISIFLNLLIVVKLYKASRKRRPLVVRRNEMNVESSMRQLLTSTSSSCKSQKEKQITIMLVTLSLTFIVLTLPYSVYEIFRKAGVIGNILTRRWVQTYSLNAEFRADNCQPFKSKTSQQKFFLRLFKLFLDVNHSTNMLCCMVSIRFRVELKRILTCQNETETKRRLTLETLKLIRQQKKDSAV